MKKSDTMFYNFAVAKVPRFGMKRCSTFLENKWSFLDLCRSKKQNRIKISSFPYSLKKKKKLSTLFRF